MPRDERRDPRIWRIRLGPARRHPRSDRAGRWKTIEWPAAGLGPAGHDDDQVGTQRGELAGDVKPRPSPRLVRRITEATPIATPSRLSPVRSRWPRSAPAVNRKRSIPRMGLLPRRGTCRLAQLRQHLSAVFRREIRRRTRRRTGRGRSRLVLSFVDATTPSARRDRRRGPARRSGDRG